MITTERLKTILAAYPRLTIGLVGDLFLDRYLEIEPGVEELSIETGLEAYQVTSVRNAPGALGTVMNNLASLGLGMLVPVTVIGDDGHGYDLRRSLKSLPVDTSHIIADPRRLTPTYTKPLKQDDTDRWRELNRIDVRNRGPLADETCNLLCKLLREVFRTSDGLIVLDQINEENWGVVNQTVRDLLTDLSRDQPDKLIFVDSRANLGSFPSGILKGNCRELTSAAGLEENETNARSAAQILAERNGQPVFCTLGEQGILVARPNGSLDLVPGYPAEGPTDIVGAGDSATSGIVASLLAGADEIEAAAVGNLVASITVQQLGTTGTASTEDLVRAL